MGPGDIGQFIVIVILLLLSSFFSSAETALVSVNKMRLRSMADEGDKRAKLVLKVTDNPAKLLGAILIGNNVVNLSASSLATIFATNVMQRVFGDGLAAYAAGISTGLLTLFVLLFGELTPKTVATMYSEKVALRYVRVIYFLMIVLTPLIAVLNWMAGGILRLMGIREEDKAAMITEDELRTIVDVSHEEGVIESSEKKMINNVVDFGDAIARDIMIPRIDMTMLDVNASYEQVLECFRRERFTRVPVYENSKDNVIGIINMKDLLLYRKNDTFSIRKYLRKPHFTFENKKLGEMLKEMRDGSVSMAIVLDEYGLAIGLITLEDLLEEIVGEIRDEYDEEEKYNVIQVREDEYVIEGAMKLDDINDQLNLELVSEDYDSIGGFMIQLLDEFPRGGEQVTWENMIFTVERMKKHRITKVRLKILPKAEAEEAQA